MVEGLYKVSGIGRRRVSARIALVEIAPSGASAGIEEEIEDYFSGGEIENTTLRRRSSSREVACKAIRRLHHSIFYCDGLSLRARWWYRCRRKMDGIRFSGQDDPVQDRQI